MNTQTKRTSANEPHQSALKKAATAANDGWMMKKLGDHHEQLGGSPVGSATTAPRSGVFRSRSATAAALGGLTVSSAKNSAAALDGKAMKRKP